MRHEISSSMDEQQSPQCGLVPPPLPSPGSPGGFHGHEHQNVNVKDEAVAGAMCEPHNKHPRKAADTALAMIKLAHVAAHAGHEPAACSTKGKVGSEHGTKGAAARLARAIVSDATLWFKDIRTGAG